MCRRNGTKGRAESARFSRVRVACVALVLISSPALQGCSVAAYGLGVATMVNDMKVREREDYERYRKEADATNAARASDGLPLEKVMSLRQWSRQNSQ